MGDDKRRDASPDRDQTERDQTGRDQKGRDNKGRDSKSRGAYAQRLKRMREHGLKPPIGQQGGDGPQGRQNFALDCGWGRLIFAQTFSDPERLAETLGAEQPDRRDIAFYVRDPHVLLASGPQDMFLDPSHTYRLNLATYRASPQTPQGFFVRRLTSQSDAEAMNRIFAARGMVTIPPEFYWAQRDARSISFFVAEDDLTGDILGTVMGIDHMRAFEDPEHGSSLWCLAVDPQARQPGVGEALVRRLAEHFAARGAATLDLSVLHDNDQAIALYEKLGFERVPFFTVKRKNPINETLFTAPEIDAKLNPYAMIIVKESRRRGIHVEVTDAEGGFFRLSYGGRSIHCRESLTELTSAVAMSICDDKAVTRRVVEAVGVRVPEQMSASAPRPDIEDFLHRHGSVVVKPARGEQGRGIAVDLTSMEEIDRAIEIARLVSDAVLLEQCIAGRDLRLVVINYRVVAAAIRRPAYIVGDGKRTVRELIEYQSRRRSAATSGESSIPMDGETERTVQAAGTGMDTVLDEGTELQVRKTANLHTGGTIHDVTDTVHPELIATAVRAARAIEIPVVGIDFMVPSTSGPDYAFIEANERPGLANHEPQPTAERFIDLLFPLSLPAGVRQAVEHAEQKRLRAAEV